MKRLTRGPDAHRYTTVRPAQSDDEIRALSDHNLDAHTRAGQRLRPHYNGAALHQLDRRLAVAQEEKWRRQNAAA
ncbi:MAG: hypothetical protein AAF845_05580 [Bacteroidota bacterium]